MVVEECRYLIAQIQSGLDSDDAKLVHRGAHTLKSAVSVFGAQEIAHQAEHIEFLGREERLEDANVAWPELRTLTERFVAELSKLTDL